MCKSTNFRFLVRLPLVGEVVRRAREYAALKEVPRSI